MRTRLTWRTVAATSIAALGLALLPPPGGLGVAGPGRRHHQHPAAVEHGGVLRVFARFNDGSLGRCFWNGSSWTWQDLDGGVTGGPAALLHDGTLRVFVRGNDSALWRYFWTGTWVTQSIGGIVLSRGACSEGRLAGGAPQPPPRPGNRLLSMFDKASGWL